MLSHQHAREVRRHEAHEANHTAYGHRCRRQQRGCSEEEQTYSADIDPQVMRGSITEANSREVAMIAIGKQEADQEVGEHQPEVIPTASREASHHPEYEWVNALTA